MNGHERRSFLERALGVITDVRAGEALIALLMTLNGFILLMAYSCIKPVREALILAQPRGAEYKVYMAAATAIVLFFAVPAYSRFSRDMSRNRLVIGVTLFFASNLLIFYGLGKLQGSFNMMIVAQFWAFANDLYTEEAGKRLFPLIGLGASVGAVAGSAAAKAVVTQVGLLEMMLLGAALLVGSAAVTQIVHWRDVGEARTAVSRQIATGPIGGTTIEAFRVVFAGRYLLLIAIFSLLFTLVKTNGDYLLSRIVESASTQAVASGALEAHNVKEYIGSFFAGYEFKIDLISLIIQAFIVSRAVKYLGVRGAFYVLPIVALGDAALMAVFPVLAAVRIGKTAESATDYSLNNTLRNMLWLPTSRRAKYLAKQATDTFFVRAGDMVSAVVVFIGIHAFGLSVRGFAAVNAVLVLVWFLLARAILKERARIRDESHDDDPGFDTPPQPAAL
jgi:AAA family ATP:ADP antiporter